MAGYRLHLSLTYCTIILLISVASTDLQKTNSDSASAPEPCNCDLDNLPVADIARSSLKPSEVMNSGTGATTLQINSKKASFSVNRSTSSKPLLESFMPLNFPSSFNLSNGDGEAEFFHTHSSPPANSFRSYNSVELFGQADQTPDRPAAEPRSGFSERSRPILRSDDILQLGNIMEPFKGPRRRRRRRRRTPSGAGNNVYYVYPNKRSGILPPHAAQSIETPPKTSRIPLKNLENHRIPLSTTSGRTDIQEQQVRHAEPNSPAVRSPIHGFHEDDQSVPWNITENLLIPSGGMAYNTNENSIPVGNIPPPTFIMMPRVGQDPESPDMVVWSRNTEQYDKREVQTMLQKAMASAWAEYGPGSKPPSYYQYTSVKPFGNHISNRQTPILLSPNFQPVTSEWDKDMTKTPNRNEVLEPGLFNRILSAYIDFEVNNHELADLIRKIFFGFVIGLVIVGWVLLGLWVGFLPYKLMFLTKRDVEGKDYQDYMDMDSTNPTSRNTIIKDLTENVYLALDGGWLKKLEEIVAKNSDSKWVKTNVHCCILPDATTTGMAECQLVRKARKDSTFKCISDLIYNFQFGPSDQPSSQ